MKTRELGKSELCATKSPIIVAQLMSSSLQRDFLMLSCLYKRLATGHEPVYGAADMIARNDSSCCKSRATLSRARDRLRIINLGCMMMNVM